MPSPAANSRHGSVPCLAGPYTSFINSVPCCAVSWTYLSGFRRAMSYVCLAISVLCHAVSYFLSSSPYHAVPCLRFCRSVPCHALPARGRLCKHRLGPCLESVLGSSVSSRVMRVSVSFRAGPFSCEGRSASCRVIRGRCKFEPCHVMSYYLCAWPLPYFALISCRSLGPCRVV